MIIVAAWLPPALQRWKRLRRPWHCNRSNNRSKNVTGSIRWWRSPNERRDEVEAAVASGAANEDAAVVVIEAGPVVAGADVDLTSAHSRSPSASRLRRENEAKHLNDRRSCPWRD